MEILTIVIADDPRLPMALEERARTGKFMGEINLKKRTGTIFPGEISSSIFQNAEGKMLTSMIIRDATERKSLDQEIRRVNTLLEIVCSSLDEAVFGIDPRTRIIIFCNDAAEKIMGYRKEEMIGRNTEFLHVNKKTFREFGQKLSQILAAEGIFQTEFNMRKKDGTVFPTDHTVKMVKDDYGQAIMHVSVVRDITNQKRAMEELNNKEKTLREKTMRLEELNTALKVLLEQRDREKKSLEENFSESINNLIIPYLDRIRNTGLKDLQEEYIDVLESNLQEIIKPYMHRIAADLIHLSPSEIRVASYVKRGYRVKEIASIINISPRTVEFHRNNIRKKLGLKSRKTNLKTYLSHI